MEASISSLETNYEIIDLDLESSVASDRTENHIVEVGKVKLHTNYVDKLVYYN